MRIESIPYYLNRDGFFSILASLEVPMIAKSSYFQVNVKLMIDESLMQRGIIAFISKSPPSCSVFAPKNCGVVYCL